MSLVDRWLARQVAEAEPATSATSATSFSPISISAGADVACPLRPPATTAPATISQPIVSQSVTRQLRQREPQNPELLAAASQLSRMSQRTAFAERGEAREEHAAIVEYDGKIQHAWSEGFARLHPDRPPADVPLRRWRRFVDDVGRFLNSPFCAVAEALGWELLDLFGADRDRPFARIDQSGLLWLLNGDRLVALTQNTATIETRTGARQTYRRKPNESGRVLAWELV
jgi:hypothetical protein